MPLVHLSWFGYLFLCPAGSKVHCKCLEWFRAVIDVIANWMRLAADRNLTDVAYHRCSSVNGPMVYMAHSPDNDCCQCSNCCCHAHCTFVSSRRREISTVSECSVDCNGSYLLHLMMPNWYCDIGSTSPTRTENEMFSCFQLSFKKSFTCTYLSSGCKLMYARYWCGKCITKWWEIHSVELFYPSRNALIYQWQLVLSLLMIARN